MILTHTRRLTATEVGDVAGLVAANTAAAGNPPLSEEALRHLTADRAGDAHHVLVRDQGRIMGYGVLMPGPPDVPLLGELAVDQTIPDNGAGHQILTELLDLAGQAGLGVWARGRTGPVAPRVLSFGFTPLRTLLQLRRELTDELPVAALPEGLRIRTFRPGLDEAAFLTANAAAFTQLPDQGSWGQAELAARMGEPWFDADGFFLAEARAGGVLAGFHWTKLHPSQPLGEIYVLAVTPPYQGRGLAAALAAVGLQHLRRAGATQAMLYVDQSNTAAVRLYERLGFTLWDSDVLYVRSGKASRA